MNKQVTAKAGRPLCWWMEKLRELCRQRHLPDPMETFSVTEFENDFYVPVYDSGKYKNSDMIAVMNEFGIETHPVKDKAFLLDIYRGCCCAKKPEMVLLKDTNGPDEDSLGHSPHEFANETKLLYLSLRAYCEAFLLVHFATGEKLDAKTATWFPGNPVEGERDFTKSKIPLARWNSHPGVHNLEFGEFGTRDLSQTAGCRELIEIGPKPLTAKDRRRLQPV